jgi:hypothetical protein
MTIQDVEISYVKIQTTKTNGRVTGLEGSIHVLETDETKHIINCPLKVDLAKLDKKLDEKKDDTERQFKELNIDLREYRFFKKYPKIAIGVLAFTCVIMVAGTYFTIKKLDIQGKDIKANGIVNKHSNDMLKADSVRLENIDKDTKSTDSLLFLTK